MAEKDKKINTPVPLMSQISLLLSQFLFLIVLVSGFSMLSGASLITYERRLSPLYADGIVSSFYD